MKPVISIHNCQTLLQKSLLGNFCSCFDNSNGQFYIQYAESRLQNIELKLDELKTIETLILTQDTRRHSLPGKIRIRRDFTLYLREIYSIMTQDTRRHSQPGKIRLERDFTLYLREFYSIMTQGTRRHLLPGMIRLGRDFTLYLKKIYLILIQDTRRHSLPGKNRLGRNFMLYFRENP